MCHSAGRLLPALGRVEGPTRAALIGVSIHADPPWDIGSYLLYHHHCYHHYNYNVLLLLLSLLLLLLLSLCFVLSDSKSTAFFAFRPWFVVFTGILKNISCSIGADAKLPWPTQQHATTQCFGKGVPWLTAAIGP